MRRFSKIMRMVPIAIVAWIVGASVFAQAPPNPEAELWRALDEDLRQAIVGEISARRGLDPNSQNPDWLIQSAEDIEEALRVSCEISVGALCAHVIREGKELELPSGWTPEQGRMAGEELRRAKTGSDGQ